MRRSSSEIHALALALPVAEPRGLWPAANSEGSSRACYCAPGVHTPPPSASALRPPGSPDLSPALFPLPRLLLNPLLLLRPALLLCGLGTKEPLASRRPHDDAQSRSKHCACPRHLPQTEPPVRSSKAREASSLPPATCDPTHGGGGRGAGRASRKSGQWQRPSHPRPVATFSRRTCDPPCVGRRPRHRLPYSRSPRRAAWRPPSSRRVHLEHTTHECHWPLRPPSLLLLSPAHRSSPAACSGSRSLPSAWLAPRRPRIRQQRLSDADKHE